MTPFASHSALRPDNCACAPRHGRVSVRSSGIPELLAAVVFVVLLLVLLNKPPRASLSLALSLAKKPWAKRLWAKMSQTGR